MVETKRRTREENSFTKRFVLSYFFSCLFSKHNGIAFSRVLYFCLLLCGMMLVPVSSNVNCSRHREKKERKLFDLRSCENTHS